MRSNLLAFAAPAAAFLVVPEMIPTSQPDHSEGAFKALPIEDISPFALPASVQTQTVNVPCASCHGKDASLQFDISVENSNKLMVNGFEVYPVDEPSFGDLKASVSNRKGKGAEKDLGWVIWWQIVDVDEKQGMQLLDFHLNVDSVGRTAVNNVGVTMSLIVGPNGEVLIADVNTNEEPAPMEPKPECKGVFCMVDKFFDELFKGGMGCHKHHQQMVATAPEVEVPQDHVVEDIDLEELRRHGHHGHHGHHGPHGHHVGKMVKNVAAHIFLPVIMGITAGVGAAVLVMFLCSIVAFAVRKLAGHEARYTSWAIPSEVVIVEETVEDDAGEKDGLMEGQAPPPAYEIRDEKE
ncbi:hypothetical protein CC79DRAFT_1320644 [Sarocladium strictum]